MTNDLAKIIVGAIESAGIKKYQFDTDLGTHLYNNDNAIIKYIEGDSAVYNIRNGHSGGSHNTSAYPLQIVAAHVDDLHEARVSGTYDQISAFLEAAGVSLSYSDIKIMLDIDKGNTDLIPENGDYNRFKPLTKKQYEELSDKEKEEYDKALAAEEKRKHDYIGQNMSASITLG